MSRIVVEVFQAIVMAVIPSAGAQEDPHVYRWRQTIGMAIVLLTLGQFVHFAISCGWFPEISSGFAWADDVKEVKDHVKENETISLSGQIIVALEKACDATAVDNVEARRGWYERLADLQQQFRDISGREYNLPPCSRL